MQHTGIAVIIPARNAGPYLDETLRSVLDQTLRPNEIIVVDDASTDDTAAVAQKFAANGVRVIPGPAKGAAAALNLGIESTSCELIAHFDADDVMLPDKLQRQVSLFQGEGRESMGLVSSDLQMFGPDGDDPETFLQRRKLIHQRCQSGLTDGALLLSSAEARAVLCREHCVDVKGVYLRTAWQAVGGFNPAYRCAYDMDFVWRVSGRYSVAIVPQILFRGRRHESNLSGRAELVAAECVAVFRQMLQAEIGLEDRRFLRQRLARELRDLGYGYRKNGKWLQAARCYASAWGAAGLVVGN